MYNAAIHMHTCIDACTDIFASLECLLNAFKFTEPCVEAACFGVGHSNIQAWLVAT